MEDVLRCFSIVEEIELIIIGFKGKLFVLFKESKIF